MRELCGGRRRFYLLKSIGIGFRWHVSLDVAVTLEEGIQLLETTVIFQISETHVEQLSE